MHQDEAEAAHLNLPQQTIAIMAPAKNRKLLFNQAPAGKLWSSMCFGRLRLDVSADLADEYPEPGKTTIYDDSEVIDPETVPLHGGVLLKMIAFSIEPYFKPHMQLPAIEDDDGQLFATFKKGKP